MQVAIPPPILPRHRIVLSCPSPPHDLLEILFVCCPSPPPQDRALVVAILIVVVVVVVVVGIGLDGIDKGDRSPQPPPSNLQCKEDPPPPLLHPPLSAHQTCHVLRRCPCRWRTIPPSKDSTSPTSRLPLLPPDVSVAAIFVVTAATATTIIATAIVLPLPLLPPLPLPLLLLSLLPLPLLPLSPPLKLLVPLRCI